MRSSDDTLKGLGAFVGKRLINPGYLLNTEP